MMMVIFDKNDKPHVPLHDGCMDRTQIYPTTLFNHLEQDQGKRNTQLRDNKIKVCQKGAPTPVELGDKHFDECGSLDESLLEAGSPPTSQVRVLMPAAYDNKIKGNTTTPYDIIRNCFDTPFARGKYSLVN